MSLLVETIKIEEGNPLNISFHIERMRRSVYEIFGLRDGPDLEKSLTIPSFAKKGIYKCRIEYDSKIRRTEFIPYIIRSILSLKLVRDDYISYPYKYIDRESILKLVKLKGDCDDILIIKKGMVTDSSYANVLFRDINGQWVTPSTYLLPGTQRASLLQKGLISEADIREADISKYTEIKLVNAMIGMDEMVGIPVDNIIGR